MKKTLLALLIIIPALSWGQLDGYLTPGTDGHLKLPSLTTAQIFAISQPKEGMQAYDKSVHCMRFFNGITWICGNSTNASGSDPMPIGCSSWQNGIASANEEPVTVKSDADGNILSLIYDVTNSNLKLKKFTPSGSLIWDRLICTTYSRHGYLKVKNVNEIVVVASGQSFISASSTNYGNYKVIINDGGTILSAVQIATPSLGLGQILANSDSGSDIEFDSDGNAIIIGNFTGTRTFGGYSLATEFDMGQGQYKQEQFIVKINPTGTVLWAYQWDSNTTDFYSNSFNISVFDLEIDENNDIFVSCNSTLTSGNCVIKNNSFTNSLAFTNKTLLLKFSNSGLQQTIYSRAGIDGSFNSGQSRTFVRAAADGVYLVGRKTVGPTGITNSYIFTDKINKITNTIIWSKEIEVDDNTTNSLTSGYSITTDAILDHNGGIYLSGYFGDCMILTPSPNLCSNASSNSSYADRFILKLNTSNGSYADAKLMGSSRFDEKSNVFLTINRFGLYSASSFSNTTSVLFGSTPLTTSGDSDAVFMRCN